MITDISYILLFFARLLRLTSFDDILIWLQWKRDTIQPNPNTTNTNILSLSQTQNEQVHTQLNTTLDGKLFLHLRFAFKRSDKWWNERSFANIFVVYHRKRLMPSTILSYRKNQLRICQEIFPHIEFRKRKWWTKRKTENR